MDIGKIIYERRKELKLTLEEIGNYVGVGKSTVKKWESGYIANIKRDKIAKLAEILQLNPVTFINGVVDINQYSNMKYPPPNITESYTTFPVIGEVAAGYDVPALEDWEGETVDIPDTYLKGRSKDEFFVLRVKGDSMFPTYQDGDKVLVLRQSTLNHSGQVGVVIYNDDCGTLKRVEYKMGEDWMKLVPINPSYPPIKIVDEELEHCKVLGIPKLLIREIEE